MKIVALSDMHGYLPPIPECDLLVIAGDSSPVYGPASLSFDGQKQAGWWEAALGPWLSTQPAAYKVIIGGNHDFVCERHTQWVRDWAQRWTQQGYGRITYLQDEAREIGGVKLFGSPWVPNLDRWAFHASEHRLRRIAESIPLDTELLITHGGPHGMGDGTGALIQYEGSGRWQYDSHSGDPALRVAVTHRLKKLKCHIFGHIHESYGVHGLPLRDILFCNVSHVGRDYIETNPLVEINRARGGVYTIT